jgi:membrane-associated protein
LWVGGVTTMGYLFGGMEVVKNNFEKVLLGIIFISILPILWQFVKPRLAQKSS